MTNSSGRLVIRCIVAILMTAIGVATMDGAVAQSRIGQIGRDGLTNRHEAPSSETEPLLRLEM
jgi:cell division protein FtsL